MKTIMLIIWALAFVHEPAQVFNTNLNVTVRDEAGNTVAGATLKLFRKEDDYLKEENAFAEGVSDEKGMVKLKKLESIAYWVLVRKDDKDNAGGGEMIGKLEENKLNKVTIVIQ
jgi:hypothetical protein